MTRIVVTVSIHRPIDAVFDYITTPANWPEWHPASRAVSGSADHSLLIGEQVTEEFVAGGRQGSCVWQVTQRAAPTLWTITTSTPQSSAEITYRLSVQGKNTLFERELSYVTSGIWLGILDFALLRRRMDRESRVALQRVKERLEQAVSSNAA